MSNVIGIGVRAAERPVEPIDVMLDNMNFWHRRVERLKEQLEAVAEGISDEDERKEAFRTLELLLDAREKAQACATDAAPYRHPRYSATPFVAPPPEKEEVKSTDSDEDAITTYQRMIRGVG